MGSAVVELVHYGDSPDGSIRLNRDSNLGEVVRDGDTLYVIPESRAGGWIEILTVAASVGSIAQVILMIADMWVRKPKKQISRKISQDSSKQNSSKDWDQIISIRVEMTDGSRISFESWHDDPEKIKSFVQLLNSPSASPKPLWVVFVFKDFKAIRVDVSNDAANKQQLEQLINYLKL